MQTFVLGSGRSRVDLVGSAETWTAARGSFYHEYEYAAFLIVAMATILSLQRHRRLHPLMWFAVATSSAASAAAFGRTALLAVLLVSVIYGIGWVTKRLTPLAWSAAIPLAGAALSGVVALPAWQQRASVDISRPRGAHGARDRHHTDTPDRRRRAGAVRTHPLRDGHRRTRRLHSPQHPAPDRRRIRRTDRGSVQPVARCSWREKYLLVPVMQARSSFPPCRSSFSTTSTMCTRPA